MTDREDFLTWFNTELYSAELALHNGDPVPRRALWSRRDPVSVLGAWRNAHGQQELDELFDSLGKSFSDCASFALELVSYDVIGDMAYTAGFEHTSACVDGAADLHVAGDTGVPPRGRPVARCPPARRHGDRLTV